MQWGLERRPGTRSRGDALVLPILIVVLTLPLLGILVGADLFLNDGLDHPRVRLVHTVALPFEWLLAVGMVAVPSVFACYFTVRVGVILTRALLVVVHGRSAEGIVVQHLRTTFGTDSDGDPTSSQYWQVEFTDGHGVRHLTEYSPSDGHPIAVGTVVRTRHQRNRPENVWVHRPGLRPIVAAVAAFVFGLTIWAFLAIIPAAILFWVVRWVVGLLGSG